MATDNQPAIPEERSLGGGKKFPLQAPTAMNNAIYSVRPGGGVHFSSSDNPGAGIVNFRGIASWCAGKHIDFPAIVKVEIALTSGTVYGQFFDPASQQPTTDPTASKAEQRELYIYVQKPGDATALMIGVAESPAIGEITDVTIASRSSMQPSEYKRIRAAMFAHWYYTCDLKDGIRRKATLPDELRATAWAQSNLKIMLRMIEKHFGIVAGLRVLDVACSAGLHALELARRGAIVTGIDWDRAAIDQAQFIQECIANELSHPVEFRHTNLFTFAAEPRSFDLIYCSGLFYHLQDPIGAAQRLARLCRRGAVMQCCITSREGDLLELSDSSKFPFCGSWEFALVPTPTMLQKILENGGFAVRELLDASEFVIENDTVIERHSDTNSIRSGPVYLALDAPLQSDVEVSSKELTPKQAKTEVKPPERRLKFWPFSRG